MNARATLVALGSAAALAAPALGQSNVDPAHKYAWAENLGWTNWRDANSGASGARLHGTFFSGYVWAENAGWISLGDGTPGGGGMYTNSSGTDHGVNVLAGGELSGFAWGENIGWINFGTTPFIGAHGARLDSAAGRLRGWAWGENIGWINLDHGTHYVGFQLCRADFDGNGTLTLSDFVAFRNAYVGGDMRADFDGNGTLTLADFVAFRNAYVAGCP